MENTQSVNLVLRTFDLTSAYTPYVYDPAAVPLIPPTGDPNSTSNIYQLTPNSSGTIGYTTPYSYSGGYPNFVLNNNNTNWTWTNINLRHLLGDMYDNYERFNLVLECVSQGQGYGNDGTSSQLANTAEDLRTMINITGLPFVNNYNPLTKQRNNVVQCAQLSIIKTTTLVTYFNQHFCATFGKSQDTVNLNIFLTRVCDNQLVFTGAKSAYPHLTFNFQIIGVPNKSIEGGVIPASRMDNNTGKIK